MTIRNLNAIRNPNMAEHLKTGHVRFSDPHSTLKPLESSIIWIPTLPFPPPQGYKEWFILDIISREGYSIEAMQK